MLSFIDKLYNMRVRFRISVYDEWMLRDVIGIGDTVSYNLHIDGSVVYLINENYSFTKGQMYETKDENGQRVTKCVGKKYFRYFPRMSDNEVLMFELQTGINVKEAFRQIDESCKRVEIAHKLVYDNNITDLKTFRDAIKNHEYFKENR